VVQTDSDAARARVNADADAARSRRFQQLALPHLDAAYNLARWLCGNANDADDVVQEAFMRAFRFFDTFRGDSARPWLLAIVRRTWYTEWRRRASSHELVEFDDTVDDVSFDGWSTGGADPQALLIRDEDTKLLHEALAHLPVEYREVLILRELEEMGYREIALVTDVPIGTVMSRLARGRRKLAALLTARQRDGLTACGFPGGGLPGAGLPGAGLPGSGVPPQSLRGPTEPNDTTGSADECKAESSGQPGAAMSAPCSPPTASDTTRRAGSHALHALPSHTPGTSAVGFAQETPDGL
jgi:RNA polymerase sigma factor (sigma-70 family)